MASELHYEILVKGPGGTVYNDINYCSFLRCPMSHTAGMTRIRLSMDQTDIQNSIKACAAHKFPIIEVAIYANSLTTNKHIERIFGTKLMCLNVIPDRPLDFKDVQMGVTLELVHPILHILGTDNAYNVIKENTTSYDVLKDFEKFLCSKHGKMFNNKKSFNHIGTDQNKNEYRYEHILVRAKCDLDVPEYLLSTYKTHNTFSLYFFDPFYLTKSNEQEVVCHYFNLADRKQFEKVNLTDYGDMGYFTKQLWQKPILDVGNQLNKNNPVINVAHRKIAFDETKNPTTQVVQKEGPKSEKVTVSKDGKRKIKGINASQPTQAEEKQQQHTSVTIATPDLIKNSSKRFEESLDLFNNQFQRVVMYEIIDTVPDYPQFGKRFNLDKTDSKNFNSIPLNIVNTFVRKPSMREPYLKLNTKVLALQYADEK